MPLLTPSAATQIWQMGVCPGPHSPVSVAMWERRMRRLAYFVVAMAVLAAASASAQPAALAPWFDSDGFYNKPNADLAQVTSDLAACRIEALRLRSVRNMRSRPGTAMAFNADGSYNPAVSGAATGIASILFAIQDARYNGSIETVEFRDCARSLGYRHYRLGDSRRRAFDATDDHGFAALVAAETPADGSLSGGSPRDNYYDAGLVERGYQNATPLPAPALADVVGESVGGEQGSGSEAQAPTLPLADQRIERVPLGQNASPQQGMAIVVVSARQRTSALAAFAGEEFRFTRVTPDGRFVDLLQPSQTFVVRAFHNNERRRDATMAGDAEAPRFSAYQIPAGRYVLSFAGSLNACLGTITFEVNSGDVAYLGDYVFQPPNVPLTPLFNPLANVNSGMDAALKDDLRVGIGDDLEAARAALQADDDSKTRLARVAYQNGYRIPCSGSYVGRVAAPGWSSVDPAQTRSFQDAMVEAVAASVAAASN